MSTSDSEAGGQVNKMKLLDLPDDILGCVVECLEEKDLGNFDTAFCNKASRVSLFMFYSQRKTVMITPMFAAWCVENKMQLKNLTSISVGETSHEMDDNCLRLLKYQCPNLERVEIFIDLGTKEYHLNNVVRGFLKAKREENHLKKLHTLQVLTFRSHKRLHGISVFVSIASGLLDVTVYSGGPNHALEEQSVLNLFNHGWRSVVTEIKVTIETHHFWCKCGSMWFYETFVNTIKRLIEERGRDEIVPKYRLSQHVGEKQFYILKGEFRY